MLLAAPQVNVHGIFAVLYKLYSYTQFLREWCTRSHDSYATFSRFQLNVGKIFVIYKNALLFTFL